MKYYIQIGDYKIPSKLTKEERFWKNKIDEILPDLGFEKLSAKHANELAESVSWNYFQQKEKEASTEKSYKAILHIMQAMKTNKKK